MPTARPDRLPTFLVIGAAKAGTGAVYHFLNQHPEIFMSPVKEPHFFSVEGQPVNFSGPVADMPINRIAINSLDRYQQLFEGAESYHARSEASVSYLYSSRAVQRIAHYVPDARLVAILRDPVERAYSSYLYMVARGFEKASFEDALADEPRRIAENWPPIWHYRQMGFYGEQLARYYGQFDRSQIRVYRFEQLRADAAGMMRDIYGFVGVDPSFEPDTRVSLNPSGVPRRRGLHRLLFGPGMVKRALKAVLPGGWRERVAGDLRKRNLVRPPLDPATAAELRAGYNEDMKRLESLLQADFSAWRERPANVTSGS